MSRCEYEVIFTDKDWRIIRFERPLNGFIYVYLEHKCPIDDGGTYAKDWCGYSRTPESCHRSCVRCHEFPPEGLEAVLWFMFEEPV